MRGHGAAFPEGGIVMSRSCITFMSNGPGGAS
jgi:hypothetical protein